METHPEDPKPGEGDQTPPTPAPESHPIEPEEAPPAPIPPAVALFAGRTMLQPGQSIRVATGEVAERGSVGAAAWLATASVQTVAVAEPTLIARLLTDALGAVTIVEDPSAAADHTVQVMLPDGRTLVVDVMAPVATPEDRPLEETREAEEAARGA